MGGAHSRRKGHSFERQLAIWLREIFPEARRQLEFHVKDANGVDLQGTGPFRFQCKKLKTYAPITKIKEVKYCEFTEIPVLVTAADHEPPMAVLPLHDLIKLIKNTRKWWS